MSDIFLSYKREDKSIAQIFAGLLELKGFSVWWDRDIDPGERYHDIIQTELDSAKCIVVLWSKRSVGSKWLKAEATNGDDRNILVPVLIENVRIPVPFNVIQAVDLIDWKGDPSNPEFLKLVDSISRKLGRPLSPEKRDKKKIELPVEQVHEVEKEKEHIASTFRDSIGIEFVLIPSGEFDMGSPSDEADRYDYEGPVHHVKISKALYMGKFEITQKQWCDVMGINPSKFKGDDLPVEQVSWNDVQEFIKKLNEKEGANKYRLPSETEWEYAARAGTTTRYFFGDDKSKLGDYSYFSGNSGFKTHPVGEKKQNPWSLYDMHGNVWEWVQDKWHEDYKSAPTDGRAWESGDGSSRVIRGGSCLLDARYCRSALRSFKRPGTRLEALGFRIMRIL